MTTQLMNGLRPQITTPFDILVRNFFDSETPFHPLHSVKLKHPVDVYEDSNGLHLEVACTGLTKEEIDIDIEGDILRVRFIKSGEGDEEISNRDYHYQGIAKRAFNFGYKVNNRFNLSSVSAKMDSGLLNITIPYSPHIVTKPKTITIK
tara:strand:+ start:4871 stop:5317 length:447 start_codon:yes stop_codon:yes gene_type:complete